MTGASFLIINQGYGHIAPRTDYGRLMTIIYAIFGIPLTVFTVTNLGTIMATSFRFTYKFICCGLCCLCCRKRSLTTSRTSSTWRTAPVSVSGQTGFGRARHFRRDEIKLFGIADSAGEQRRLKETGNDLDCKRGQEMDRMAVDDGKLDTVVTSDCAEPHQGELESWRHQLTSVFVKQNEIDKVIRQDQF